MGKSPKAKRKALKKEKEDAKKKLEEEEEQDEAEFQKVLLEIRVNELENLNLGLIRKCEYLESRNEVYKVQLQDTKEEKEDLVTHLQKSWTEEKTNVKELEDRLYGVQQARVDDSKLSEKRLAAKDKQFDEMKAKLEKHIIELGAKLTALEDFRIQKEKLTAEKEELNVTLEADRKNFKEKYEDLENQLILYRERLKKESTEMLIQMANDVQNAGKLCLTATVKSAISTNIRLQDELETMAKDNLKLRQKLQLIESKFRERRMTIEVLEEENSMVHRKCLKYRDIVHDLLERQTWMEMKINSYKELERELIILKIEHSKCKTEEQIRDLIGEGSRRYEVDEQDLPQAPVDLPLQVENKLLRDIIIKMAMTAKDLCQASNTEELDYLKGRFKVMLVKLYQTACDLPDLSQDIKNDLVIPAPNVSKYLEFR